MVQRGRMYHNDHSLISTNLTDEGTYSVNIYHYMSVSCSQQVFQSASKLWEGQSGCRVPQKLASRTGCSGGSGVLALV